MPHSKRPISPHLQIYRPQLSSVSSILHRITGAALLPGAMLFVVWLLAAASGQVHFDGVTDGLGSVLGQLMLFGWCWAVFYHLLNGVRHLIWDSGRGYEIETANRSAKLVIGGSILLAVGFWLIMTGNG